MITNADILPGGSALDTHCRIVCWRRAARRYGCWTNQQSDHHNIPHAKNISAEIEIIGPVVMVGGPTPNAGVQQAAEKLVRSQVTLFSLRYLYVLCDSAVSFM